MGACLLTRLHACVFQSQGCGCLKLLLMSATRWHGNAIPQPGNPAASREDASMSPLAQLQPIQQNAPGIHVQTIPGHVGVKAAQGGAWNELRSPRSNFSCRNLQQALMATACMREKHSDERAWWKALHIRSHGSPPKHTQKPTPNSHP